MNRQRKMDGGTGGGGGTCNNNRRCSMKATGMRSIGRMGVAAMGLVLALTAETGTAGAALLQVDMQRSDGTPASTTQSGWQAWAELGTVGANSISKSFSYRSTTGGTLNVTYSANVNFLARNRGLSNMAAGEADKLTYPDLWADLILAQVGTGTGGSSYVQLVFSNLKAGEYTFRSYHYDDALAENLADNGKADVLLNSVDTMIDQELLVGLASWTSSTVFTPNNYTADKLETDGVLTTAFTVANDGDTVTIRYNRFSGDTFGINGFELIGPPPKGTIISIN